MCQISAALPLMSFPARLHLNAPGIYMKKGPVHKNKQVQAHSAERTTTVSMVMVETTRWLTFEASKSLICRHGVLKDSNDCKRGKDSHWLIRSFVRSFISLVLCSLATSVRSAQKTLGKHKTGCQGLSIRPATSPAYFTLSLSLLMRTPQQITKEQTERDHISVRLTLRCSGGDAKQHFSYLLQEGLSV